MEIYFSTMVKSKSPAVVALLSGGDGKGLIKRLILLIDRLQRIIVEKKWLFHQVDWTPLKESIENGVYIHQKSAINGKCCNDTMMPFDLTFQGVDWITFESQMKNIIGEVVMVL